MSAPNKSRLVAQSDEPRFWAAWLIKDTAYLRSFSDECGAEWWMGQMKFSDAHRVGCTHRAVHAHTIQKHIQCLWAPSSTVIVTAGNGWSTNLA